MIVRYSISVTRAKCVPAFGPDLPDGPIFTANDLFRDFILTKIVNGHNSTPKGKIHNFLLVFVMAYLGDLGGFT